MAAYETMRYNETTSRPKKTPESMLLQYQERLNYWPDNYYEQANPLARCGIFSITHARKDYTNYTPIRLLGEGNIEFKGQRLTVFDEEVFLQLLVYCRGMSLVKPLIINKATLLTDLRLTNGSGKNYKRLSESLDRLDDAKIRISSPAALSKLFTILDRPELAQSMSPDFVSMVSERFSALKTEIGVALKNKQEFYISVGFIQNNAENRTAKKLIINIDPLMVLLFDGTNTTRTSKEERHLLCPAEKRLLTFFLSHANNVFDMHVSSYRELLGSEAQEHNARKFTGELKKWVSTLERLQRIEPGWSVENGKVCNIRPIAYEKQP